MFSNNGTYTIYLYSPQNIGKEIEMVTLTSYTVDEDGIGIENSNGDSVIF